jgi:phage recombination protein Bet
MELTMNALVTFSQQQLALIKRTVAKDCNDLEFDTYIELCKARGLNPLLRHAFAQVYSKNDKDKRQMVIVVSREGQRSLAERTKAYRPDERAPRFAECEKSDKNPAGLLSAEVSVYKHSHGEWFPVTEVAYWEEYAPNPPKDLWRKMPRVMLAKCAEMAALRKAFPDDFGGLYGEAEIDRGEVLDLTPSEWAEKADQEDRMARIGGPNLLVIDWIDGNALAPVPADKFLGQAMDFVRANRDEPSTIAVWQDRNKISLQQFWGVKPAEALVLKQEIEKATASGAAA